MAEKKVNTKRIISIIVFICLVGAVFFGKGLYEKFTTPDHYIIHTKNQFDYQSFYECSGYASAYVLRSLGVKADGVKLYEKIPDKNSDGTVSIDALVNFLNDKGYHAKECHGTNLELKNQISKGVPVIAFVRVSPGAPYFHYLPIVGYDKNNFYAADSLTECKNADSKYYNRKIPNEDFEDMWSTKEVRDNTYITLGLN